ncbi:MAG TPA: prepilin peptidase [Nitrosomonas sp.]|nr:prepilin peptidase [Nitrosomonas sp.]
MSILIISVIVGLLLIAVYYDIRTYRIPNKLILIGIAIGSFCAFLPYEVGGIGITNSLLGFAVGLIILLPLYLSRAMGAGDIKLMGMIGIFVGPLPMLLIALYTAIAGGILAVIVLLGNGKLNGLVEFFKILLLKFQLSTIAGNPVTIPIDQALPKSNSKLPYGVAIAAGTFFYLSTNL